MMCAKVWLPQHALSYSMSWDGMRRWQWLCSAYISFSLILSVSHQCTDVMTSIFGISWTRFKEKKKDIIPHFLPGLGSLYCFLESTLAFLGYNVKLGAISVIYCLTVFETRNPKSVTLVPSGGAEKEWFSDGSPLYSLICNHVTWISASISTETTSLCTSVKFPNSPFPKV